MPAGFQELGSGSVLPALHLTGRTLWSPGSSPNVPVAVTPTLQFHRWPEASKELGAAQGPFVKVTNAWPDVSPWDHNAGELHL